MADNYRITGQQEGVKLDPAGAPVRAMEITFETVPSGVSSRIEVPMSEYTAEHVAELVGTQAATIEAVHAL